MISCGLPKNAILVGKTRYKDEFHEAEHRTIMDVHVFEQVQAIRQRNDRSGGWKVRIRHKTGGPVAVYRLRLRDEPPTHDEGPSVPVLCTPMPPRPQGLRNCPSPSIPVGRDHVSPDRPDQGRRTGRCADPANVSQARRQPDRRPNRSLEGRIWGLLGGVSLRQAVKRRTPEIVDELVAFENNLIDGVELAKTLAESGTMWDRLCPRE